MNAAESTLPTADELHACDPWFLLGYLRSELAWGPIDAATMRRAVDAAIKDRDHRIDIVVASPVEQSEYGLDLARAVRQAREAGELR